MISKKHIDTATKVFKFWETLGLIQPLDKTITPICRPSLEIFYPNIPKEDIDRLDYMYIKNAVYMVLQYSAVVALTTEHPSKDAIISLVKENPEGFIAAQPTAAATATLFSNFTYAPIHTIAKQSFPKKIPGKRDPNSPFKPIHVLQNILDQSVTAPSVLSTPGICVTRIISPYFNLPCLFNITGSAR